MLSSFSAPWEYCNVFEKPRPSGRDRGSDYAAHERRRGRIPSMSKRSRGRAHPGPWQSGSEKQTILALAWLLVHTPFCPHGCHVVWAARKHRAQMYRVAWCKTERFRELRRRRTVSHWVSLEDLLHRLQSLTHKHIKTRRTTARNVAVGEVKQVRQWPKQIGFGVVGSA